MSILILFKPHNKALFKKSLAVFAIFPTLLSIGGILNLEGSVYMGIVAVIGLVTSIIAAYYNYKQIRLKNAIALNAFFLLFNLWFIYLAGYVITFMYLYLFVA